MHRWHFNTFHQWFNMTNDFPTFASFSFRSYLPSCLPSRNLVFHISWCSFFQDQNALLPPPTGPTLQTLFPETFQLSTFVYTVVLYVTVLCRVVLCCVCVCCFPMIFPVVEGCYDMFPYTPHLECLGIFQRLEHPNSLGTPSVGTSKTQVGMTGMTDGFRGVRLFNDLIQPGTFKVMYICWPTFLSQKKSRKGR